jgi:hypothetical protein
MLSVESASDRFSRGIVKATERRRETQGSADSELPNKSTGDTSSARQIASAVSSVGAFSPRSMTPTWFALIPTAPPRSA